MWNFILQNLLFGVVTGSLYAMISIGMTMVNGLLNILHIAHASVVVLGAYSGMLAYNQSHNIIFAIFIAIFVCAVVGSLMYLIAYKKILSEKGWVALLVSVGIFIIFGELFRLIFGPYSISFRPEIPLRTLKILSFTISPAQTLILVSVIIIFVIAYYVVNKSKIGLSWKALAQDKMLASAFGINVERSILYNFIFGSALAGFAGFLMAAYYNDIYPTMGDVWSYKVFAVMVLGGLGNVSGTIIASYILGIGEAFIIALIGYFLPKDAIAFILMFFVLMFTPYGIMGKEKQL
jgi:branched-chain amino acid transport system permease protein